mgnify:CR=1 FL=1
MYDDPLDRPPWLRNLRPRSEVQAAPVIGPPALGEPFAQPELAELGAQGAAEAGSGLNRRHLLWLALLLWANVTILGCLCLLATGRLVP